MPDFQSILEKYRTISFSERDKGGRFERLMRVYLLTDYKALILTLNETDIPRAVQDMITDRESEINVDDSDKLIGCINALSKQLFGDDGSVKMAAPAPMRRAVAFCSSIAASKAITAAFNAAVNIENAYHDAMDASAYDSYIKAFRWASARRGDYDTGEGRCKAALGGGE